MWHTTKNSYQVSKPEIPRASFPLQNIRKTCASSLGLSLPSMTIVTIKKDSSRNPLKAKYHIVVFSNHENKAWRKSDMYVSICSQLDMRVLLSLAISHNRSFKQADCKNFCLQSDLQDNESGIVEPPHVCPIPTSNSYWFLSKSLYSSHWDFRHWYEHMLFELLCIVLIPSPLILLITFQVDLTLTSLQCLWPSVLIKYIFQHV